MRDHFVEAITGRGGTRLTPGEYAQAIRSGANVKDQAKPLTLLMPGEEAIASKAMGALLAIHPPQPFVEVGFDEILLAFNFYKHAPLEDAVQVDAICETIAKLNGMAAEKQPAGSNVNPLLKKFLH